MSVGLQSDAPISESHKMPNGGDYVASPELDDRRCAT